MPNGKTTQIALQLLADAAAKKGEEVIGQDHFPGKSGQIALLGALNMVISGSNLDFSVKPVIIDGGLHAVSVSCTFRF